MYDVYWLAMQMMLPIWGSKYLEYISRIRYTAMICSDNNKINEAMLQNIESLGKQNIWAVYNIYNKQWQSYTWFLGGTQEGICMKAKGDYPTWIKSTHIKRISG
jgi:hypothetical protein